MFPLQVHLYLVLDLNLHLSSLSISLPQCLSNLKMERKYLHFCGVSNKAPSSDKSSSDEENVDDDMLLFSLPSHFHLTASLEKSKISIFQNSCIWKFVVVIVSELSSAVY